MSESENQIPDLAMVDFPTWKQKILGYCQQLGFKTYLKNSVAPAGTDAAELLQFNLN